MQCTISRSHTVQSVLKELRRDIVMGNIPNDTPVTELQFAKDYDCSRAALRGALTVLEGEGLIRVMPNGTKRISSLTKEDICHIYELRSYVECTALSQALSADSLDIGRLVMVLENAKNGSDFLSLDALFHETLVSMSGNKALMQTWRTFSPVIRELFSLNFSQSRTLEDSMQDRHMHIIKLLMEKDKEAVEVLREHIEEARRLSCGENI